MPTRTYRLMAIHQRVDRSIREEMKKRAPAALRLLRLRAIKLIVKERLRAAMPIAAAG